MKSLLKYVSLFFSLVVITGLACSQTPYFAESDIDDSAESSVLVTYLEEPYENYLSYTVELFLPEGSVVQPAYANGYTFDGSEYILALNHVMLSARSDYPPNTSLFEPFVGTHILGKQQDSYGRFATFPGLSINRPYAQNIKEYGYFLEPGRHSLTAGERFTIYEIGNDSYYFDVVSIRE